MDTFRSHRLIPMVLVAATTAFVSSAPLAVHGDESILKRMVGVVAPRRASGPLARMHRRIEERPAHRNDYQDGLVVHAGGAYAGQFDSLEGHGGNSAAACRGGHCDDHCVVRPDRFGYYETQWRQWPGTSVVQAAGIEELTPASPPRLELPSEKEESLDPRAAVDFGVDEPVEDSDATTLPGLGPVIPPLQPQTTPAPKPVPAAKPLPRETRPEPTKAPVEANEKENEKEGESGESTARDLEPSSNKPSSNKEENKNNQQEEEGVQTPKPPTKAEVEPESKIEPQPPAAPVTPSTDDNLFDEAGHRRRLQERLAVLRSEARAASVVPAPFADPPRSEPVPEWPPVVREDASPESAEPPPTTDVRPAAFQQDLQDSASRDSASSEANPLRSWRERGWRARPITEARSTEWRSAEGR